VTTVFYSSGALTDLERLAEFLVATDPDAAAGTGAILMEAIAMLLRHPLVGRIVEHGLRELVISRGRSGYVALYRFDAETDQAFILAIRHQREMG
jgi:plasmid stabilization system protein ParE